MDRLALLTYTGEKMLLAMIFRRSVTAGDCLWEKQELFNLAYLKSDPLHEWHLPAYPVLHGYIDP